MYRKRTVNSSLPDPASLNKLFLPSCYLNVFKPQYEDARHGLHLTGLTSLEYSI